MSRLVRNTTPDGACKYALVRLDKIRELTQAERGWCEHALNNLEMQGVLEYGKPGAEDEFFAIKLKDPRSTRALDAYADACHQDDREFSEEVRELAERSGQHSPFFKDAG